jgi:hypothetical protein
MAHRTRASCPYFWGWFDTDRLEVAFVRKSLVVGKIVMALAYAWFLGDNIMIVNGQEVLR